VNQGIVQTSWIVVACLLARGSLLFGQGFSPEEAVRRMTLAEGFCAQLVAAEPLVRQPVAIEFDDRGRLWVIQYLQYPNPAGLKRVHVDRYSRTVYDRVPEPPPRGPKGDDRITILEDLDANGRAHRARDFVSGLNLASGLAFGDGGVYVLQAPYLLFYPDHDGDGVPDGDPEVLLSGFGMEDAHAVANSLTWGPDGWLYGCQGSTVTAHIRGVEFQQGVWRYHPRSRRFELFCEGGGNSWGLDFDRHGNLLYSTNVGGYVVLHGVQGGYYWKSFGKHGALHNPYTYGYIDHVPHRDFHGGHVTVGGIVYQGDAFPERFRDTYLAADLLGHAVYWHTLEPTGSTFRSRHGGELLRANDSWFAPCDLTMGPDGAVYVADWYDRRTAHPDPDADWDRSNGRIYKIEATSCPPVSVNLARLPTEQLIGLLSHRNDWYTRRARRILGERRDPAAIPVLRKMALESADDHLALEALWALYVSGGFEDGLARRLLAHRSPDVRRWTVRFLGDGGAVSRPLARQLVELAAHDPEVTVRSQLASIARRLPAADGLPLVERILLRNEDGQDAHIPLLAWWAVERHAVPARDAVLECFTRATAWRTPLIRDAILGRLMQRYAAEGTRAGDAACARLLASAPTTADREQLLVTLDQGLRERPGGVAREHDVLDRELSRLGTGATPSVALLRVRARLGHADAQAAALDLATDERSPTSSRQAALEVLAETATTAGVARLLPLLRATQPEAVQLATLSVLEHVDRDWVAAALLQLYPQLTGRLRARTTDILLSRERWALAFLHTIDQGRYPAGEVATDQLRHLAQFHNQQLEILVRKHWGSITGGTPEEKLAEVRRLNNDLRAEPGNPVRGRELFQKHCAECHRLFGEGNMVGPDLTHANRKDRDALLVSLVDPSAVIRKEYLAYVVQTTDGRLLTGLLSEQTAGSITLLGAREARTTIARAKIESIQESTVSLMPENLLRDLKPTEVRDLFSYLQSDRPSEPLRGRTER
jgi:putative membrane-bound dehydrogenase-like protein